MSPKDLFDVVCDLDDRADDLQRLGYPDESMQIRVISQQLKGFVELRLAEPEPSHE